MAEGFTTPIEDIMQTRSLTVAETLRQYTNKKNKTGEARLPVIHLTGRWLEAAGFQPGAPVAVAVEAGRLTITHAVKESPPPPIAQTWEAEPDEPARESLWSDIALPPTHSAKVRAFHAEQRKRGAQ